MKEKPHIRLVEWGMFGFVGKHFVCKDKYAFGTGETPADAYADYLKDMPKTPVKRFFRLLANRIYDAIFG